MSLLIWVFVRVPAVSRVFTLCVCVMLGCSNHLSSLPPSVRHGVCVCVCACACVCVCVSSSHCVYAGLRGTTCDVVLLEEAAYQDRENFYNVIVPLMSMDKLALLAISTPDDENNYFSILVNLVDVQGKPLFKVMPIGLACEACKEAGKAADCQHKLDALPRWRSEESQRLQRLLLPDDVYQRESQGLIVTTNRAVFSKKSIEWMFSTESQRQFLSDVGVVFVSLDPSGGSQRQSALSMVAIAFRETTGPGGLPLPVPGGGAPPRGAVYSATAVVPLLLPIVVVVIAVAVAVAAAATAAGLVLGGGGRGAGCRRGYLGYVPMTYTSMRCCT